MKSGRIYLAMPDTQALRELLSLWQRYKEHRRMPNGRGEWTKLFSRLLDVRPWGPQDRISPHTIAACESELGQKPERFVRLEIELWFHDSPDRRARAFGETRNANRGCGRRNHPPSDTPAGVIYLGVRRVDDNVWVRSAEAFASNIHQISSIFENGRTVKSASLPFMTFWTLPVDDDRSVNFFVSHVGEHEEMSFEKRRELEIFGQWEDRPYRERQWIPGDHDAQVSQGPINIHALEHLGTQDRGIVMFRRFIRRGIQMVQKWRSERFLPASG